MAATAEAPTRTAPSNLKLVSRNEFVAWLKEHKLERRRRVLVSGDRNWADESAFALLRAQLSALRTGRQQPPVLIEGEASGIDSVARRVGQELDWPVAGFPCVGRWWNLHGRAAGMMRNEVMLSCQPERVIGFSPAIASSRGTRGCLLIAWELGLPVRVVDADGNVLDHQRTAPSRTVASLHTDLSVRRAPRG